MGKETQLLDQPSVREGLFTQGPGPVPAGGRGPGSRAGQASKPSLSPTSRAGHIRPSPHSARPLGLGDPTLRSPESKARGWWGWGAF